MKECTQGASLCLFLLVHAIEQNALNSLGFYSFTCTHSMKRVEPHGTRKQKVSSCGHFFFGQYPVGCAFGGRSPAACFCRPHEVTMSS